MGGKVGAGPNHRESSALPKALGTRIIAVSGGRRAAPRIKPPCAGDRRRPGDWAPRLRPSAAARSRPIARSSGWLRADGRGIALHRSNAASARCDAARGNARTCARRERATCARPPRVHGQAAVPTWGSRRQSLVATGWSRRSMARRSNDGQTTGCARTAHPNHERIIIRFEPGREGKPSVTASAWGKLGRRRDGGGPKTDPPGRGNPGGSR
jgi:hypothetical protein